MSHSHLLIVGGLPGAGKTQLATRIAKHYSLPLLAKDAIKETLFDTLGTGDPAWSASLSNASFATLFVVAEQLLEKGASVVLEGNFRPGEHEARLHTLCARRRSVVTQLLCRVPEDLRLERLQRRAVRGERHAGHLDSLFMRRAAVRAGAKDDFLDLPGLRIVHSSAGDFALSWPALQARLDEILNTVRESA
jgi:predicted kinase